MSDDETVPRLPLAVGVSTRAMFDLEEEHAVFESQGVRAYIELQRAREELPLKPGAAFEVTRRLLALNRERSTARRGDTSFEELS